MELRLSHIATPVVSISAIGGIYCIPEAITTEPSEDDQRKGFTQAQESISAYSLVTLNQIVH